MKDYKVIAHQKDLPCPHCKQASFCVDCGCCTQCGYAAVATYFPPMWLYNRAIVKDASGMEFVLQHLRLESSRETSSVELIPSDRSSAGERLTLDKVEQDFTPTGRRGSVIRWS